MKKLIILATVIIAAVGCGSGEPEVTNTDKDNLERLHKDGIGKVMAEDAAKKGKVSGGLANPDGSAGPAGQKP